MQNAGILEGDYLVTVGDENVKWSTLEGVIQRIKKGEKGVWISVVSPDKDTEEGGKTPTENLFSSSIVLSNSRASFSSVSSASSTGSSASGKHNKRGKLWSVLKIVS